MEIIFAGIFWLTIALIIHTYVNYPMTLWLINFFKSQSIVIKNDSISLPSISIIISAYNEEKVIASRIENIKNLNYDFENLELIIGSDCSSDMTNEIIINKSKEYKWIKSQIFETRRGKAAVLNDLSSRAKNEITVFTDANTRFEKNTLINLVSKFSNKKVGGVCGHLQLAEPTGSFDRSNREKLYWKYETQLKKLEGELGILIAANGGIYAIRKELFVQFPSNEAITDDLYQTFAVLNQGYFFIFELNAIANEDISNEIILEFRRKVRFASTNFQTLKFFKNLLFNKNLLVSYALWSHKILRWFIPLIGILFFVSNLLIVNYNQVYSVSFIVQLIFYISVLIGFIFNKLKINISIFSIIYYYFLTNLALLIGLIKFLLGEKRYTWESTPR